MKTLEIDRNYAIGSDEERVVWRFSFGWKAFEQLVAGGGQHREEETKAKFGPCVSSSLSGVLTWLIAVFSS